MLVLFSGQSAAHSAPEALLSAVPQAQVASNLSSFRADTLAASLRALPAELGNLRETFIPAAQGGEAENESVSRYPVVLHVQDAHANHEAQARIKDILEWIHKTSREANVQGPVIVALEGSVGKLHPEYLEIFPEFPEANEALVKDLVDKGELTGSDLYLWEQYKSSKNPENKNKSEMIFWGAEDPELYRRNLNQFRELLFKRSDVDALLQSYESLLAIAQSRILNPQLRDFLKESERTEVLALAVLKHAKPTLGIDLQDKIEQLRFPNLTRFSYLREIEPLLDAELARMDWNSLKAAFEKNKIPEELTERFGHLFSEKGESGLSLRQTAEEVFSHPGAKKIRFRDYPHLLQWASYRILAQEISSADFIFELEQLKQAVMTKLSQKKEERDFIELYRDYLLFRKVLHLEVTREEYAETEAAPEKFIFGNLSKRLFSLVKRDRELEAAGKEVRKNEPLLQDYYKRASAFYRGAGTRDLEILENALSFYQSRLREEIHPEETKSAAPGILVIVTGGFHSEGMTSFLKDRGIPHLVFVPRISKIEEDGLYFKVMRRDQADLSSYFDKNPLNKQESLLFKGLIEKAAPELTQRYGISSSDIPGWIEKAIQRHPVLSGRLSALVFSGEGKPFVRVSAQSAKQNALKIENQSVSEVALLNAAGTGAGSYGDLASQPFDPSLATSVTVTPGLSGHSTFQKAPPAGGTLATQLGNLDVTMGPIDAGNLALLKSAANQFEGLRQILNPSTSQIGPGGLIVPSSPRSELRATEAPGEAPSIGEISLDKMVLNQDEINRIVETYDLITITADVQDGLSYGDYYKKFDPFLAAAGKALKALRVKEKRTGAEPRHKVFMMKTWTEVGSTENFFDTIKWNREPTSEEGNNDFFFDVVYQPDFSHRDESGREASDQVLFGVRDYGKTLTEAETARRDRTTALLRRAFQGPDFMSSASAEQTKNDLFLYLAAKLTHFNDLAKVSERYGADLSVVAYGAGLDKRIRKLFTNPSLGFGGRLAQFLEWVREERLEEVLTILEQRADFFSDREKQTTKQRKLEIIEARLSESVAMLREIAENPESKITIKDILDRLPPVLHFLFELETILDINKRNLQDYSDKISAYTGDLRGKKASLIGVGYREGENRITKSPAKRIIRQLVAAGVTEFYVADAAARDSLLKWITEIRNNEDDSLSKILKDRRVRFVGVDEGTPNLDIYSAAASADFVVIPTDAEPGLKNLDIEKLKASLGEKYLFDGINLFGLRANGETLYPLEVLRAAGIRYVSVGRPALNLPADYALTDSQVIGDDFEKGKPALGIKAIREYQDYILQLETDTERRDRLAKIFALQALTERESNAVPVTAKRVAVIGGGYVGLTTGANLADLGNDVTVLDIPQRKAAMDALNSPATEVPIHEPGLRDLIIKGKEAEKLRFQALPEEYAKAVEASSIVYLAVGTPQQDNGAQDPAFINGAIRQIGGIIQKQASQQGVETAFKTIVIKSTVTPRIFEDAVKILLDEFGLEAGVHYGFVSNPEFLREGQAIKDITTDLDRTVLGFYSGMPADARKRVEKDLLELWYPLMLRTPHTVLLTDTATSTLIKYAANAFLAVSITTANVMAQDAALELQGSNFREIAPRLRKDKRVGANAFLSEGCGYGGSCFPKDVRAVNFVSDEQAGRPLLMIVLADQLNQYFKTADVRRLIDQLRGAKAIGTKAILQGKIIGLLGMAFKAETDDMREAPSAHILYELLKLEARQVRIDDPIFRVPDAPRREVIISNYLGEVYKHFKHDPDFEKSFQAYLKSSALNDPLVQQKLFPRLRFSKTFQNDLRERIALDRRIVINEEEFFGTYGSYFDPRLKQDPWSELSPALITQPLIKAFEGLLSMRRVDLSVLEDFYFREVYFKQRYLDTGRVVFVQRAEEALYADFSPPAIRRPVDAALLITDWKEYKDLDYSGFKGQLLVDTRNTLFDRAEDLTKNLGIGLIGPGRRAASARSELRQAPLSVFEQIVRNSGPEPLTTSVFRKEVAALPADEATSLRDFLSRHPGLVPGHEVSEVVTASFVPADWPKEDSPDIVSYIQLRLISQETTTDEESLAVKQSREALGNFAWLLDSGKTPAQIILPLEKDGKSNEELFRVAMILAAADKSMRFTFLVEDSPQQARAQAVRMAERRLELGIPDASVLDRFKFVPSAGSEDVRVIKQIYSENKEIPSAVIAQKRAWLEKMGYIPRMSRVLNNALDRNTAVMVTAALLRQLKEQYDPVALGDLLKQYDLNVDELVESVSRMIQVINHLATQA